MNQSFFDNGDSVVVIDQKGKIRVRDNHAHLMEELQLENFSEYCDYYLIKLRQKSKDLHGRRRKFKKMVKTVLGATVFSVPICSMCGVLLSSSFVLSSLTSTGLASVVCGGFLLFQWKVAPKKKEIDTIDKKIEFFVNATKTLEKEAKEEISKEKVEEHQKNIDSQSRIYEVVPSEQLQDVEAVMNFIDKSSISTPVLHAIAIAGDMQESLLNVGFSPRQASLLTEYYSKVEVSEENTFAKAFYKEK